MLLAISVKKGCCSHQNTTATMDHEIWGISGLRQVLSVDKPSAIAATPKYASWGDSGWRKAEFWPQTVKVPSSEWFQWGQTLASSHTFCCCCSVSEFGLTDSLWPQGLQHARLPCPLPSPGVCSDPRPLCRWYHSTTLSSVTPFSSRPQSFPASGSFPMSRVFSNDSGLCIRWPKYWSFRFSISPFYVYSGLISFRIEWSDLLAVQGTHKSLL